MTDNRITKIAEANGIETILNKLTEECGELIAEIARYQAQKLLGEDTADKYADMYGEAADVWVVIEQFKLENPILFKHFVEQKLQRQCERMGIK